MKRGVSRHAMHRLPSAGQRSATTSPPSSPANFNIPALCVLPAPAPAWLAGCVAHLHFGQAATLQQLMTMLTDAVVSTPAASHDGPPLHVEVAGLVAAVDGSRCLLVLPDTFWVLLQHLHAQAAHIGSSWGEAPAATTPLLVHAGFSLDRTTHGRMQVRAWA